MLGTEIKNIFTVPPLHSKAICNMQYSIVNLLNLSLMAFPFVTMVYVFVSHTDIPVWAGELRTTLYAMPYAHFYAQTLRL